MQALFTGRINAVWPLVHLQVTERVDALEPALFECIATFREFTFHVSDSHYLETKSQILLDTIRNHIPDDELPTEGYPKEADNG